MASRPGTRFPDPAPARPPAAIRFAKKAGESSGLRRLVAALALLAFGLLLPAMPPGAARAAGANEFLPRDVPALKRFAVVASTANNQCLTTQLIRNDPKRVVATVLLSPCEFSLDNQTQGFFISRPLQDNAYQIFFAANPSYCLAMEPRSKLLVVSGCALDSQMLEELPQLWDVRGGGLSLKDAQGKKWCLDTQSKPGFSMLFEPRFIECPEIVPDTFILRVSR